ncbi:uncharacterized protein [Physcomitrium patens]|uniref:uncharacterized protein isoform X2 n=1 Tax=Physcomitrium patens TaxID=3218 RepID=UPI003CCD1F98
MVRRLCLFLLGVDILLPRPVVTIALVSRSSAAAYQQLASAECGGSFPMVPLSMACGAQPFPVSLLGDSFNFIGCLLTGDQLATQNLSAGYFMLSDFVVISQYMYYQQPRYQEKELLHSNDEDGKKSIAGSSEVVCTPAVSSSGPSETCNFKDIENAGDQRLKGLQRHLAQCPCGEAVPLLLNQAHDLKSSKRENFKALPSHTPSSPSTNKHLRRVVMQYGLEYGPPTGSLLRMHHGPLRKHGKYVRRAAAVVVNLVGLVCLGATAFGSGSRNQPAIKSEGWAVGRKLLVICNHPRTLWMRNSGTLIGWASASLYLGSRISQVVKNADRGSAEGLSLGMVLCAISANLAYGVSVFMRLSSWQEFVAKAPWIVGSLGTVSLDIILLLQSRYLTCYAQSRKDKLSEHTPLLA